MEYKGRRVVWDIEANGLLDATSIDYLSSPYKLKDSYVFHCIAAVDLDTKEVFTFVQGEIKEKWRDFVKECGELIAHNQINYDLLAMKLYLGMDYSIGDKSKGELDYVDGRPCKITDTLVISKTLNPDRYLGQGIEPWGKRLGLEKIDWRAKAIELGLIPADEPKGSGKEFAVYVPEMLEYNIRDVEVNILVYEALMKEWGTWKWDDSVNLEHMVAEIITRQSHRGFWFDKELAEANVIELDKRMEEIRQRVEPLIPRKPLGKTALKGYTPPATQFLKSGMPNAHIINFIARHKGKLEERGDIWVMIFDHGEFTLPCSEPIIQDEEAKLSSSAGDSTHLKGWLVGLGWKPSQYKERDLTCDSKKNKLSQEKYVAAVNKYVEQTLSSPFCKDRLDELETTRARLASKLLGHDIKRPMKVYTNPTITVGQEKEVDPKLLELMDVFPYAKDVSDYYSYTHRRNSILGGGVVMDELDEDEEPEKGFLSEPRLNIDGRIPTPADTCGAGTSRFKHKKVANIARITSIFGKEMRGLFGANREEGMLQLAYDFDSLEAKVEASYVYNYEGGVEYGISLSANKPNDCHSVLARKITELIGKAFPRNTAKAVKYGCSYNAQPKRVAKTVGCDLSTGTVIFDAFWEQAKCLKELKEAMQKYWETTGEKKFLRGIDGRKLPIRSKGNVINTAFQSCGVICAKRAMVEHEYLLKQAGMYVDFFTDNWKSREFCSQMIAYHDEAQLEISRTLVSFKKFETEAECLAFTVEDKLWSDPIHNDKGWFRAYCRAGELAVQSVGYAGTYYKLNVPLTAGYMIGTNWATCH